ncbi:MAG: hypothetical protein WC050_00775, partial [Candidatus Paceibacterota bacterium]
FVVQFKIRKKKKGPDWYEGDSDTQDWVFSITTIERVGLPRDAAYRFKGTAYPDGSNPDHGFNIEATWSTETKKGLVNVLP